MSLRLAHAVSLAIRHISMVLAPSKAEHGRNGEPTAIALAALALFTVTCLAPAAESPPSVGKVTVIVDQADIKVGDEVIAIAKKGEVLEVSLVQDDWYALCLVKGWIHKSQVKFEPTGPVQPAQQQQGPSPEGQVAGHPETAKAIRYDSLVRYRDRLTKRVEESYKEWQDAISPKVKADRLEDYEAFKKELAQAEEELRLAPKPDPEKLAKEQAEIQRTITERRPAYEAERQSGMAAAQAAIAAARAQRAAAQAAQNEPAALPAKTNAPAWAESIAGQVAAQGAAQLPPYLQTREATRAIQASRAEQQPPRPDQQAARQAGENSDKQRQQTQAGEEVGGIPTLTMSDAQRLVLEVQLRTVRDPDANAELKATAIAMIRNMEATGKVPLGVADALEGKPLRVRTQEGIRIPLLKLSDGERLVLQAQLDILRAPATKAEQKAAAIRVVRQLEETGQVPRGFADALDGKPLPANAAARKGGGIPMLKMPEAKELFVRFALDTLGDSQTTQEQKEAARRVVRKMEADGDFPKGFSDTLH